jgi:hypothetical protein
MTVEIAQLKAEHYANPIGIETPAPRLSWTIVEGVEGWKQKGYEITVKVGIGGN